MDYLISGNPVNKMAAIVNKVSNVPVMNLSEKEYQDRLNFVETKQRVKVGEIEVNIYHNEQIGIPIIEIPSTGGAEQFYLKVGSAKAKNLRLTKNGKLHMT